MREYSYAVVLGRFQPPHKEHQKLLQKALEIADKVLILIGSYRVAPNIKNPFSYEERKAMLETLFSSTELSRRVHFIPIRDHYYSDALWCAEVQQKTSEFIKPGMSVALVGTYKDHSSYYLNLFPQWETVPAGFPSSTNSTDIRKKMFSVPENTHVSEDFNPYQMKRRLYGAENADRSFESDLPPSVAKWLLENFYGGPRYHHCVLEHRMIEEYRAKSRFTGHKFVPVFVTVDAVVIRSGHLLVVTRKFNPGKGLYALPGGFVRENERLERAVVRELKEETGIRFPSIETRVGAQKVFDYPGRSLRGRTITHAFLFDLGQGELPEVHADDDAATCRWMSLADVFQKEDQFYEDHFHIAQSFTIGLK